MPSIEFLNVIHSGAKDSEKKKKKTPTNVRITFAALRYAKSRMVDKRKVGRGVIL